MKRSFIFGLQDLFYKLPFGKREMRNPNIWDDGKVAIRTQSRKEIVQSARLLSLETIHCDTWGFFEGCTVVVK